MMTLNSRGYKQIICYYIYLVHHENLFIGILILILIMMIIKIIKIKNRSKEVKQEQENEGIIS